MYDRWSSLFWLALSVTVFIESIRLGIGTPRSPGMGFIALGASGLLGILSLALFIKTTMRGEEAEESLFAGKLWYRVVSVACAILVYARVMPVAGYLITTFLFMTFLYWVVGGQKWWWVVISSFLTTIASYYLFSFLNCQFPAGFLGF